MSYRLFRNEREFLAIKTMARNSLSFPNSLYIKLKANYENVNPTKFLSKGFSKRYKSISELFELFQSDDFRSCVFSDWP